MSQKNINTILDKMTPCDKERFWSKVDIKSEEECWEWKDSLHRDGYGYLSVGGRTGKDLPAHRIAKTLSMGEEIIDGLLVMHSCDNPPCCNPSHLELGTNEDNLADMANKGRAATSFGNAKIDWDIVDTIRQSSLTGKELSEQLSIPKSSISEIRNHKTWKEEHRSKAFIPMDIDIYQLEIDDDCIRMVI